MAAPHGAQIAPKDWADQQVEVTNKGAIKAHIQVWDDGWRPSLLGGHAWS